MKHHHLVLVSALASALAACGGGQDGAAPVSSAASNATGNATSNASANVTITLPSSPPAARQVVADAARNAAAAQRAASEAQAHAAAQRAALEEARRKSVEAAAKADAANAQERAAARQAADEAVARYAALQIQFETAQQALQQQETNARQQAEQLQKLEAQLVELVRKNPPQPSPADAAQTANGIPACDQNAAPVRDPETGLWLVCESQIVTSAQTADVGTSRHASGRYYALPFPDQSMMFVGPKAGYKYACGEHFCEWLKQGGSLDIEYAAEGSDGKFYRFTSCRTGLENKRICAMPKTGFPAGVDYSPDGREPEPLMVGPDVDTTDVSGQGGFRAGAAKQAPAACAISLKQAAVLPWPGRERFRQQADGMWQALFYGGNCVGDVRVETANPDAPTVVFYTTSTSYSWPRFSFGVAGPDGRQMVLTHFSSYGYGDPSCEYRQWRVGSAYTCAYRPAGAAATPEADTNTTAPAAPAVTPAPTDVAPAPAPAAEPVPGTTPAPEQSPAVAPVMPEPATPAPTTPAPGTPAPADAPVTAPAAPTGTPAAEPQDVAAPAVPASEPGVTVPATPAAEMPAVPVPPPAAAGTDATVQPATPA